ncbi:MAG: hypothetical protein OXC07_03360 [Kistimonas sp.]|nr:hypothetical protein [Kistimonas sp.]
MHTKDMGLVGAPPLSPPVLPQTTASEGAGPVVAESSAALQRQVSVSGAAGHAQVLRPGGTEPACWPVPVLRLMFRGLNIAELIACGQVCRHWCHVAGDRSLQMHCLLQTWPPAHRRQLERALDTHLVRARLTPWCDGPVIRPEEESSATGVPTFSPPELLLAAVRRLLLTARLDPKLEQHSSWLSGGVQDFLCNPDGRLVTMVRHWSGGHKNEINVWETGLRRVRCTPATPPLEYRAVRLLAFSSDGCQLRVFFRDGGQELWQPFAPGDWRVVGRSLLCEEQIRKAVLSPDGQRLAVVQPNAVLIFDEDEAGTWRETCRGLLPDQWCLSTANDGEDDREDHDRIAMCMSDDNRHLVMTSGPFLLFVSLQGTRWKTQPFTLCNQGRGQPVFDSHSCLLSLVTTPDSTDGRAVMGSLLFFRFEALPGEAPQWRFVKKLGGRPISGMVKVHPRTGYSAPLAFSPDGQRLVLPSPESCHLVQMCSVRGPEAWQKCSWLNCVPRHATGDDCELVLSAQFSASSSCLAVRTEKAVVLWRGHGKYWNRLHRLEVTGSAGMPFAFSPDGFHCVTSAPALCRLQEQIGILGPVAGGRYEYKYLGSLPKGCKVEKMLFTPDATRVLVAVSRPEFLEEPGIGRLFSSFLCLTLVPGTQSRAVAERASEAQEPVHDS